MKDDPTPLPVRATDVPDDPSLLDDPRLRPFLPLLYIAWADGDLSPEELRQVNAKLDAGSRRLLAPWLDPTRPPSPTSLVRMLKLIRDAAPESAQHRLDLIDLGLELARADSRVVDVERGALERLAEALGLAGSEAARQLLTTRRPARREPEPPANFDVSALTDLLHGPHAAIRARVFALLEDERFQYRDSLPSAEYREQVLAWCQLVADEGLGGLSFPSASGEPGDIGGFIAAFEALCFFDLSLVVKVGVQFGLFGGSILNLGTQRHHQTYLKDVASLDLPGCFAMTETGHGSNVADLETVARFDPKTDEFIIHTPNGAARKDYIGNAALHARMATVFAQLELGAREDERHGVHAFLVPIRDAQGEPMPGVTIGDCGSKLGLIGVDNGRLTFDHVRIGRANLLDRFAQVSPDGAYSSDIPSPSRRFFTMLGTLVGGRVSVASGALSVAQSALSIAVLYGLKRRQFGPPDRRETRLLDYPTHQLRLMPRLAATYAMHFAMRVLQDDFVSSDHDDRRAVEASAAGLKALATWHATDTVQTCRECCGGQGYLEVNRLSALKADSDVFTTFEGDNTVLLQLVAKSLLGSFKRQFGRMTPLRLVRYVAERAAVAITELNPVVTRQTSDEHLLDRETHLEAFAWREHHRVANVAQSLKRSLDAGSDANAALLAHQVELVAAAVAHVEHAVLRSFADAIAAQADGPVRERLRQLCDLYALWRWHSDAYFLEHGYVEGRKSRAIGSLVARLSADVRTQAGPLVRAFGIPDKLLAAPIAL